MLRRRADSVSKIEFGMPEFLLVAGRELSYSGIQKSFSDNSFFSSGAVETKSPKIGHLPCIVHAESRWSNHFGHAVRGDAEQKRGLIDNAVILRLHI